MFSNVCLKFYTNFLLKYFYSNENMKERGIHCEGNEHGSFSIFQFISSSKPCLVYFKLIRSLSRRNEMLMKVNKSMFYISGHIYERNVTLFFKYSNRKWKFGQGLRRTRQKLKFNGTLSKKFKIFLPWWCTSRCGPRGCPSSPCRRRWRRRRCWWGRSRSRRCFFASCSSRCSICFESNLTWFPE